MRRVRDLRTLLSAEGGQSLTEFAIIAPVIVGILIFAIFFYEATQIKLKQQEAERYVAWEFTGKKLTDYGNNGNSSSLFNQAKSDIVADAMDRFDNLVSINKRRNQREYIMTEWELREPTIRNEKVPDVPGGGLVNLIFQVFKALWTVWDMQRFTSDNFVHYALMAGSENASKPQWSGSGGISGEFGPSEWKFNTKGYVQVKMKWRVAPTAMFTKRFMDNRFDRAFRPFGTKTLDDKASQHGLGLVVDHWNLQDGQSIGGGRGNNHNTPYYKQVERMTFVTSTTRNIAKGLGDGLAIALSALVIPAMQPPLTTKPSEVALTSIPYGPGNQEGKRNVATDQRNIDFDTAPYTGAYKTAYDQRGQYFMGCREQGIRGCNRSLATNNPFGEFIIPRQ